MTAFDPTPRTTVIIDPGWWEPEPDDDRYDYDDEDQD